MAFALTKYHIISFNSINMKLRILYFKESQIDFVFMLHFGHECANSAETIMLDKTNCSLRSNYM